MAESVYDAAIVGGGPGGSTVATLLAKSGKRGTGSGERALSRFHIGESLLPYNRPLFEEMGVLRPLKPLASHERSELSSTSVMEAKP